MTGNRKRQGIRAGNGAAALALAAALVAPAAAQTLRVVSRFDQDLEGWEAVEGDSSLAWSAAEPPGTTCDPYSGSARATNFVAAADEWRDFLPPQCVWPVTPNALYSMWSWIRFPAGQDRTGTVRMRVVWKDGINCTGSTVVINENPGMTSENAGIWRSGGIWMASPAIAESARVEILLHKVEAGGELQLEFDEIEFVQGVRVFRDGFENGTSCRWTFAAD